ncbi:hypothetical protein [Nitrospirillum iridis]|uniref:Uncharacterized protein n=1 Tax=Nitrospirillum iridis TaxID=765888 RepID=A0A7X0B516_9PROT|nr:hypothetical protein [Nitrospirillum iridis]MBB6254556.1 hypothetical protein [Nitrospirillum iridis]
MFTISNGAKSGMIYFFPRALFYGVISKYIDVSFIVAGERLSVDVCKNLILINCIPFVIFGIIMKYDDSVYLIFMASFATAVCFASMLYRLKYYDGLYLTVNKGGDLKVNRSHGWYLADFIFFATLYSRWCGFSVIKQAGMWG